MTHDELVQRAVRWLKSPNGHMPYRCGCYPVFGEKVCSCISESPDAVGWTTSGSVLIECKTSRGDFLTDKRKWFRTHPAEGMGRLRYYMAPIGLLREDELPVGWGLLAVSLKQVRIVRQAEPVEYSTRREILFLRSEYYALKISEPPTDDIEATRKELQEDLFSEAGS